MDIRIIQNGDDDWDALYVDGDLRVEGSFSILNELEDLFNESLAPVTVTSFFVNGLSDEGREAMDEAMTFPEIFEEVPAAWLT